MIPIEVEKKRLGACYIRVSTDDQTEYSPDSQERLIREYAEKNNIFIPDEYVFRESEGISGRKADKRPEFQRMIGAAKQKPAPFEIILVWKFSRFARNQEESIVYKSMLRKQCGVDVVSISEPLMEGPFGGLIERIIEWMDEFYSIRLSGEVKRGMTERISRGKPTNAAPFGYRRGNDNYEIVPEDAELVRQIFERFINGESYLSIARWLRTVCDKRDWENRTVEYILRNPAYIGMLRAGIAGEKNNSRDFYGSNMKLYQGTHQPILSPETFQAAQKRADHIKNTHPKWDHSARAVPRLWTGILKCSNCGGTLSSGGKNDSWQCVRYLHGKGCGVSHYTTTKAVSEALLPVIIQDLKTGKNLEKLDLGQHTKSSESQDVIKQIDRLKARLKRVREAYEAGVDTLAEYKASREAIEKEIETLQHKVDKAPNAADIEKLHQKLMEKNQRYIKLLQDEKASDAEKNEALHHIVDKIVFQRSTNHFDVFYSESYML